MFSLVLHIQRFSLDTYSDAFGMSREHCLHISSRCFALTWSVLVRFSRDFFLFYP